MRQRIYLIEGIVDMKRRIVIVFFILAISVLLLCLAFEAAAMSHERVMSGIDIPEMGQVITPTISNVLPEEIENNIDQEIEIFGENFLYTDTLPGVMLGRDVLTPVHWITTTYMTAVVPWGLDGDRYYTITVTNPDGGTASLVNAIYVTNVISIWKSGGPDGGFIKRMAVHPQVTSTVFAYASEVGLYRTKSSGDLWNLILPMPFGLSLAVKTGTGDVLVAGGDRGLFRSYDDGDNWQKLISTTVHAVAYGLVPEHPLYVAISDTVIVSQDDGENWGPPGIGLPSDTNISFIAVHPYSETVAYASCVNGRMFETTDEGNTWNEIAQGYFSAGTEEMVVDLHNPDYIYRSGGGFDISAHYSWDKGRNWDQMRLDDGQTLVLNDIDIPHNTTGLLYAARGFVYTSTDNGATWYQIIQQPDSIWNIELDPISDNLLYGGGVCGPYRYEEDGGITWIQKFTGIRGVIPWTLAAVPDYPDRVFAGAMHSGGFASVNAGGTWIESAQFEWDQIMSSATSTDPKKKCEAYLGGNLHIFYHTINCGEDWTETSIAFGLTKTLDIQAIAVDPFNPDHLLLGALTDRELFSGAILNSSDRGGTWEIVDVGPISGVTDIVFDPNIPDIVYFATGVRMGDYVMLPGEVHKSTDGGTTWDLRSNGLNGLPINDLAIDPSDPNIIYAALGGYVDDNPELLGGVYKSQDGGETWVQTNPNFNTRHITDLVLDPLDSQTIYAGVIWEGLYRSKDGGITWKIAEGPFNNASVYSLASAKNKHGNKVVFYVGMTPGSYEEGMNANIPDFPMDDEYYGSGVYALTIIHVPMDQVMFMPLIMR
jgi:photosystem II stability/assembly factor-like uncharacterized protein